jgi:hypothetical protein
MKSDQIQAKKVMATLVERNTSIREIGYVPQVKASKRDKHFKLLGLTTFAGTPLMCVVIFQGKNHIPEVETGIAGCRTSVYLSVQRKFFGTRYPATVPEVILSFPFLYPVPPKFSLRLKTTSFN